jgi:DNA-binding beta-propeller fold protein YncE
MKKSSLLKLTALAAVICMVNYNCRHDQSSVVIDNQYPAAVGQIMTTKCVTTGCHNSESASSAANLDLSTWTNAFKGSKDGAMIIPYSADQSWVSYFINTNPNNGPALTPTMPMNQLSLSPTEIQTLNNWINEGAPDANGNIAFSDPTTPKVYVTNQGCDNVTVYDANTQLASRYITVGNETNGVVSPHQVQISPDGQYWYVIFIGGNVIQKYSTATNQLVGNMNVGTNNGQGGSWTSLCILPDGNHGFAASWTSQGELVYIDLNNFTSSGPLKQFPGLSWPHAIHSYRNNLYVTSQYGNFIYKYNIDSLINSRFGAQPTQLVLAPGEYPVTTSELDPHEIAFTPDSSEYLVTCQQSNEVRVFSTATDKLLAVIPVGTFPQEMAMSKTTPYVYVTCMYDGSSDPTTEGSVCIINYQTNTFVKKIQQGLWEPHGITMDETNKIVYVANQNATTNGPAPHHTSYCGGRDGYSMLIDMNTMDFVPNSKRELSVDTYADAFRPGQ